MLDDTIKVQLGQGRHQQYQNVRIILIANATIEAKQIRFDRIITSCYCGQFTIFPYIGSAGHRIFGVGAVTVVFDIPVGVDTSRLTGPTVIAHMLILIIATIIREFALDPGIKFRTDAVHPIDRFGSGGSRGTIQVDHMW